MIRIPPYMQPGDTIGLVCPAGYMSLEKAQACISSLADWGYQTRTGRTVGGASANYFSGDDQHRLEDLQQMLDDDEIKTVLCARGGYGIGRIIEKINFDKFTQHPKWIIGFSDVTILHSHIYSNYKIATIHAPMASAFDKAAPDDIFVQSMKNVLEGKKIKYECDIHPFNKKGEGVGELVGGNLTLLAHLVGTSSDIRTKERILFLEDRGEYLYNVDRMLYQLKRSGKLSRLAGLIVGGFIDMKDTERPFGKNVHEIIYDAVKDYDYPVCFNFPVSHGQENLALKIGLGYKLKSGKRKVTLEE